MNITVIARADLTGLGVQSRNWVRLLNPSKIIVIDSRPFNNNQQYFEWYNKSNAYKVSGFIQNDIINPILDNTDVLLTFEIPYNYHLFSVARSRGVKTILQNNWEFTDYLKTPNLPLPDLLVNHSYWHLEDQKKLFPEITDYCPTPVFVDDYKSITEHNMNRVPKPVKFLHIAGRKTYEDRNGTQDLINAVKLIPKEVDFELVIKTQTVDIDTDLDPRIIVDSQSPVDEKQLYYDFDAMILPRRYAGACLPMNEALTSGMPVIMPDIDPNNKVLPKKWLVKAEKKSRFMARVMIDVYSVDHAALAKTITKFAKMGPDEFWSEKRWAHEIALREYSDTVVREKWSLLLSKLGV